MKNFWNRIDKALLGSVTVVVTFSLGFLWWIYQPSDSVPMWLFSVSFVLFYAVCVVLYAVCSKEESVVYRLPEVRTIVLNQRDSSRLTFVLEKSDLLSTNIYVTILYQNEDDEIETVLGLGIVENINTQGSAQVVFTREADDKRAREIIESLSNTKKDRRAIKVTPSVTSDLLEDGFANDKYIKNILEDHVIIGDIPEEVSIDG